MTNATNLLPLHRNCSALPAKTRRHRWADDVFVLANVDNARRLLRIITNKVWRENLNFGERSWECGARKRLNRERERVELDFLGKIVGRFINLLLFFFLKYGTWIDKWWFENSNIVTMWFSLSLWRSNTLKWAMFVNSFREKVVAQQMTMFCSAGQRAVLCASLGDSVRIWFELLRFDVNLQSTSSATSYLHLSLDKWIYPSHDER